MDNDQADAPVISIPPVKLPNRERACVNCRFSAVENRDRVCRYNPPRVTMFMVPTMMPGPGGRAQQGVQFKTFTQFPTMRDDQNCGKFEPRLSA